MPIWENRQLREARQDRRAAENAYREHLRDCVTCTRAVRKRQLQDMCAPGWRCYSARRDAAEQLALEREADKLPVPGQEVLFDL